MRSFFKITVVFLALTVSVSAVCIELFSSVNDEKVNQLILTKPLEAQRDLASEKK